MAFKFDLFFKNPYWNFNASVVLSVDFFFCFQIQNHPKQKSFLLLWQLKIQYSAIT